MSLDKNRTIFLFRYQTTNIRHFVQVFRSMSRVAKYFLYNFKYNNGTKEYLLFGMFFPLWYNAIIAKTIV